MKQRISLITPRARDAGAGFHDALGWAGVEPQDGVTARVSLPRKLSLHAQEKPVEGRICDAAHDPFAALGGMGHFRWNGHG